MAQDRPTPGRAGEDATEIVLIGTSHFAGSPTDEYTTEAEDILSARRQRELDSVATAIAHFAPDQFYVERTPDQQARLDSLYRAYRTGDYDPTAAGDRNEVYQLAFRAGDRSGLERLGAVDAEGVWLGDRAHAVAEKHTPEVLRAYRTYAQRVVGQMPEIRAQHTLGEWLTIMNTDSSLYKNHKAYVYYYARMGSFDDTGRETKWEGDLDGQTVAVAGDFGGYPIERGTGILESMGARVTDAVDDDTDYLIRGKGADAAVQRAEAIGAEVLSPKEAQAMIFRKGRLWVGFPDHHIGADLVGEWYKRNLRIYANIWRTTRAESDRVMLLMGQGHIWSLRQFFRENPDFEVVPVREVL